MASASTSTPLMFSGLAFAAISPTAWLVGVPPTTQALRPHGAAHTLRCRANPLWS